MGQGEEVKTRPHSKVEILERGDIFFFYRPKVNKEEAHSVDDVQRLYIVLCPESGERTVEVKQESDSGKEGKKKGKGKEEDSKRAEHRTEGGHGCEEVNIEKQPLFRFLVMGRKRLPDPSKRSTPYWGFVEMVTTRIEDIKLALKGEEYETATRGHRYKPPARALAEGVYRIVRHQSGRKTHTHLIYKLEFPPEDESNVPHKSLNVKREGSFLIQIKNPERNDGSSSQFRGLESKRKGKFPASLQAQLGSLRFAPADPPDFLNYEGCEFLFISASDHVEEELGLELKTECEGEAWCSDLLQMIGDTASPKPLLSGTWA